MPTTPTPSPACACGSTLHRPGSCSYCREAVAHLAAASREASRVEAARPDCHVCGHPIEAARRYRGGWVYHETCSRCERPVCGSCIGDADWDPNVGGVVHCKLCAAGEPVERCAECGRPAEQYACRCGAWLCGPGRCAWQHEARCEAVAKVERR